MTRNPAQILTLVLGAICALLLLLILLFWFGVGRGYHWWELDDDDSELSEIKPLTHVDFKLPPWESFAEMNERPLFNEDRRPTPPAAPDAAGQQTQQRQVPLNVTLTGVILSPKMKIAMLKAMGKQSDSMTVKEGSALPGDLGAWKLAQVKPRAAVFHSMAGDEVEVELIATGNGQKPAPPTGSPDKSAKPADANPPVAPQAQPGNQQPGNQTVDASQAKPAEHSPSDLQQRIEARRQQIREQNDRAKTTTQPQQQR